MQLQEFASLLTLSVMQGNGATEIKNIQTDSRKVKPGDLFICIPGLSTDGHRYAAKAVEQGAAALVVEHVVDADVPQLVVADSRYAMSVFANHFYHYPSRELKLIGVTGTNGKTTTTYLIDQILSDYGMMTGLMGTIQMKIGQEIVTAERTTQEALELQRNLRHMCNAGAKYCIMEVSSHALELGRVKGCRFKTALFTNLTQDHLDYHHTMENYRAAKGLLFSRLGNEFSEDESSRRHAVLNADDPASEEFRRLTSAQVITYGVEHKADVSAADIRITPDGTSFTVHSFQGTVQMKLKLVGKFNVYNALGAITVALIEGVPLEQIKNSLERVQMIAGRMESVQLGQDFLVLVDYAHSPDGLENALATIREFAQGKVYTVFGCGGDRDRTKRPIMGQIAAKYSDYVFVTSDNPRSEEPNSILKDIERGIQDGGFDDSRYELIVDRKSAIQKAVDKASAKDVVLIAGKGHETYQIIGGITHDFDDRLVAKEAIRSLIK